MSYSSWQSRLQAKQNVMAQKLIDNSIALAGLATDVIIIRSELDKMGDPKTLSVHDIDIVNMIFPAMKDLPLRRFYGQQGTPGLPDIEADDAASDKTDKPFETYAPVNEKLDHGTIIIKFFEHSIVSRDSVPTETLPWILVLEVKDIFGTFGARGQVWQKINLGYYNNMFPEELMQMCTDLATRRGILKW